MAYVLTIAVTILVFLKPTPFGISVGRQRYASRLDCGAESQYPRKQMPGPRAA